MFAMILQVQLNFYMKIKKITKQLLDPVYAANR